MKNSSKDSFKSGFIALIGRPNVGKSSMVNKLVGEKVAITANKPQTTRNRIAAIVNVPNAQMVFMDTPGIHKPGHALGDYMVEVARQTIEEVDIVLFVVDATAPGHPAYAKVVENFKDVKTPVWAVVNKCDVATKDQVNAISKRLSDMGRFDKVLLVSALTGDGMDDLTHELYKVLPEGPAYYPAGTVVDHPEEFIVSEFIREKLIKLTREEIPHSVAVTVEEMKKREDKEIVDVSAVILVEKESQKGIVIGAGGSMLKQVGMQARSDIERLLGSKVNLTLWVKVKKDWRDDVSMLTRLGYE